MAQYTPMIEQYLKVKEGAKDAFLFFRLGDFYEMFFEDAILASKELEITLTGREGGGEEKIPMCGVPYHAAEGYIQRLIEKGYKVAICEQLEDASVTKGMVKRDIVRVVTPGTVMDGKIIADKTESHRTKSPRCVSRMKPSRSVGNQSLFHKVMETHGIPERNTECTQAKRIV